MHVGHGRGAAYGAAVADLLEAVGYAVHREYYVNDAGRQMDILAASVWLRYLELCGEDTPVSRPTATKAITSGTSPPTCTATNGEALPPPGRDRIRRRAAPTNRRAATRRHTSTRVIARRQALLGAADYRKVFDAGLNAILGDIRQDLQEFGVDYRRSGFRNVRSPKTAPWTAPSHGLRSAGHTL